MDFEERQEEDARLALVLITKIHDRHKGEYRTSQTYRDACRIKKLLERYLTTS
jgi:hypothetical protein